MKVVLDTNVLVSARISPLGKPAQILARVGVFELLISLDILAETENVLQGRHIQLLTPAQFLEVLVGEENE